MKLQLSAAEVVFVLWPGWEGSWCRLISSVPNPTLFCACERAAYKPETQRWLRAPRGAALSRGDERADGRCDSDLSARANSKLLPRDGVGLWHWSEVLKTEGKDVFKNHSSARIPFYVRIFESLCF